MRTDPTCPRCAGPLHAPSLWSSAWECAAHGGVPPYTVLPRVSPEAIQVVRERAHVPIWVPHPLPPSWVLSGLGYAGDDRTGATAVVLAALGPSPLGGAAELLLIAEEPGVGLGTRYAGLPGTDPGDGFDDGPPHAKLDVAGHPTAMWSVPSPDDCAAFVGEAKALWLWALVWPGSAGVLLYEQPALRDLRDGFAAPDLAFGAPSPRLAAPPLQI